MRGLVWSAGVAILAAGTAVCPVGAEAQPTFQVIRALARPPEQPTGPPVEIGAGVFALAMASGGARNLGAIVRLERQPNGTLTTTLLHSFSGPDGDTPRNVMRGIDGALYGITRQGGATNQGTAFRLSLDGDLTTIHSFSDDLQFPDRLLSRTADGRFFGASEGRFGCCVIFALEPDGTVTRHPWLRGIPGFAETAAGDVYAFDGRFVSKVTTDGPPAVFVDLAAAGFGFPHGNAILTGTDGNFYLTSGADVTAESVSVLRVTPSGSVGVVAKLPGQISLSSLIEGEDGHLYASNQPGKQLFRVTKSGIVSTLHTFTWWLDGDVPAWLMQASDGRSYGAASRFGLSSRGTVFEFSGAGVALRSHFSDPTPLNPSGTLVRGADGALYGTSCAGGDLNVGTVFKVTEAGAFAVVHSFRYWDGTCPGSGLVRTNDGALWGTARASSLGQGTIFRISPAGVFTLMRILGPGDGRRPLALLVGADGNLYGTTSKSDGHRFGTVFRMTPAGAFTVLHEFTRAAGTFLWPWSGLAQSADGALYGTAIQGTDSNPGGAFRLTLSGEYTEYPLPGIPLPMRLIRAVDGGFFGTSNASQVFRVAPHGPFSIVHALSRAEGYVTIADLMQATDTQLYGTAWAGGASDLGTIFRVTAQGVFEKLHDFSGSDGANPFSGLIEPSPGIFYGLTTSGGPGQGGVIFRLVVNPSPN